jgi:hypothetical protein
MQNRDLWVPVVCLSILLPTQAPAAAAPELPRLYVDTTYARPSGRVLSVNTGGDFQGALNTAQCGDVIALQAGATFTGPFTLPNKACTGWIYVQSSAYSSLPPPGTRVSPADAPNMPKLTTASGPCLFTNADGAHHFRFVGIEIAQPPGLYLYALVYFGAQATTLAQLPHDIVFDRVYVHGDPGTGIRKGIAISGVNLAVVDSYVTEIHNQGDGDTNAFWTFNGPGPIKLVNNYLASGGENVMFGGTLPTVTGNIPADIEVRRNYVVKPAAWTTSWPAQKNLIEWKHGMRVLVDSNIFENQLVCGQKAAWAVGPRADTGTWATISDLTFTNNILRNACGGLFAFAIDAGTTVPAARLLVRNSLMYGLTGNFAEVDNGFSDVTFDHVTAIQGGSSALIVDASSANNPRFTMTNTIVMHGAYGVFGGGVGTGTVALTRFFSPYTFRRNVIAGLPAGASPSQYPPDNFFPGALDEVKFVDRSHGNFRLASNSPFRRAGTDGRDIGVDMDALEAAIAEVITGGKQH